MKTGYNFTNLFGCVYSRGTVIFTPDGDSVLSPCFNRVNLFDLAKHKSVTLPFQTRCNIDLLALSPNGGLLLAVDMDGYALLVNFPRRVVLHHFNFKDKVQSIKFSPDSKFFVAAVGKRLQVWRTPSKDREFAPFVLHRTFGGHYDSVTTLDWSEDSAYIVSGSMDLTCRVYSLYPDEDGYTVPTLGGHHEYLVGCYFVGKSNVYSVSKDGACFNWKRSDDGVWSIEGKHFFQQDHSRVRCVTYHKDTRVLVAGFDNGVFGLYEMPDFNNIHSLSISKHKISTVSCNSSGEWLAFGCAAAGQLLVWEWQSESYVLKQQGHFFDMNVLSYSPDGQIIATGGDDGKVKLWNTSTGFCYVTFTEHTGAITSLQFSANGQVVFTTSLDGSCRAFDLNRYRNFRVFSPPTPTQLSSVAVDPSGEIVCAGSKDSFQIHVWSVQTGKLLDSLAGHDGPVSSIAFNPTMHLLASASWDKTVRIWDVFSGKGGVDKFTMSSEVLSVAFRPDGKELVCTTLDGQVHLWDTSNGELTGTIEGRRDITGGRRRDDRRTAKTTAYGKAFNSVCYTANGRCLLAGGNSKYVCLYDLEHKTLLKKFTVSQNRSLDGVLDYLNSKNMTEAGAVDSGDDDSDSDVEDRLDRSLPGAAKKGDASKRRTRLAVRTKCVRFAPTGRSWAAASTEGLLLYSLDDAITFDPVELDVMVTPETTLSAVNDGEYTKALVMAFRLNEVGILHKVFLKVPLDEVQVVAQSIPTQHLERLLSFIAEHQDNSVHLEYKLVWIKHLLNAQGGIMKQRCTELLPTIRHLQKSLLRSYDDLSGMCNSNKYTLSYLLANPKVETVEVEDAAL